MSYGEYKKWLDDLIRTVSTSNLDGFIADGEHVILESDYGQVSLTRKGNEVRARSVSGTESEFRYRLDKDILIDSSDSTNGFE